MKKFRHLSESRFVALSGLRRQSGVGIAEVMIAVGILSVVTLGIFSVSSALLQQQNQATLMATVVALKSNFTSLVNNPTAWSQTINHVDNRGTPSAPKLECLNSATLPCTANGSDIAGGGVAITNQVIARLKNAAGNDYYVNSATNGFTRTGASCNTFATPPAVGNDACPFHYNITWSALCTATSCIGAQANVDIKLVYNPAKGKNLINPENYSVSLTIGGGSGPGSGVPAGAVMAFNLVACPSGWTEFTAARGRAIAGTHPTGAPGLSFRPLGSVTGAEGHTLTIAEMPSHNHYIPTQLVATQNLTLSGVPGAQHIGPLDSPETTYTGGGQPHSIMQPTIFLLMCQKN